jgi:hypothetical protein
MVDALGRLYWAEFFKWVQAADCEWRVKPLVNVLEEYYSEFDDNLDDVDIPRLLEKQEVLITI